MRRLNKRIRNYTYTLLQTHSYWMNSNQTPEIYGDLSPQQEA
jgi:hypothetical protein